MNRTRMTTGRFDVRNGTRSRRGMALLMVLGVLALLSVLAVTFVRVSQLELNISRGYVERTRALLTAESGVEYALARLRELKGGVLRPEEMIALAYEEDSGHPGLEYAIKPSFNLPGADSDISGRIEDAGDTDTIYTLRVRDESGKLNINDTNGRWNIDTDAVADSDTLGEGDDADIDAAAGRLEKMFEYLVERLWGDVKSPTGIGASATLALFDARAALPGHRFSDWDQVEAALVDPGQPNVENPLTRAQFEELVDYVTLWSWQDPDVIRPSCKVAISTPVGVTQPPDNFDLYIWSDFQPEEYPLEPRCPININMASKELLEAMIAPLQGWYLKEGPADSSTTFTYSMWCNGDAVFGIWNDGNRMRRPDFCYRDEPVGPTASPEDSAPSYLNAVNGKIFMTDGNYYNILGTVWPTYKELEHGGHVTNRYGTLKKTVPFLDPARPDNAAATIAEKIYDYIHGGPLPNPFDTWEEFADFIKNRNGNGLDELDVLPPDTQLEYRPGESILAVSSDRADWWRNYYFDIYTDVLLAMFNPNSDLNDFNPTRSLYRNVDKGQLTQYTVEAALGPTGVFNIESCGAIRSGGLPRASVTIDTVAEVFRLYRLTTQQQFMKDLRDGIDAQGDFFSKSEFSPQGTYGAATLDPDGYGYSLQSYPEPYVNNHTDVITRCHADGQLMLATLEHTNFLVPELCLQASFAGSLKPHIFGNNGGVTVPSGYPRLDTDDLFLHSPNHQDPWTSSSNGYHFANRYNYPTEQPLTWRRDDLDPAYDAEANRLAGVLYPDGAYSDAGRVVCFRYANTFCEEPVKLGNEYGYRSTVSLWIKPNFHAGLSNRIRKFLTFDTGNGRGNGFDANATFPGLYYFPHNFDYMNINNSQSAPSTWPQYLGAETHLFPGEDYPDWMVSHSLAWMQFMSASTPAPQLKYSSKGGVVSYRANHDFPERDPDQDIVGLPRLNFEGHTWTHCAIGYEVAGDAASPFVTRPYSFLSVNGWVADLSRQQIEQQTFNISIEDLRFGPHDRVRINYWRFGEVNPAAVSRYMADSTIDEFVVFPVATGDYEPFIAEEWDKGRYNSGAGAEATAAVYTSPTLTLRDMHVPGSSDFWTVHSVAWTVYKPRSNRGIDSDSARRDQFADNYPGLPVNPNDDTDPVWGKVDPVSVDVSVNAGAWVFGTPDSAYTTLAMKSNMPSFAGGCALRIPGTGAAPALDRSDQFRFRLYFNLDGAPGTPLYDSPVLDDVTFTLMSSRPAIFKWLVR